MKNRITIGISSIIFIFMVLCLSVFSLLSLSDAKSALTFAQKRADTVAAYYKADTAAQTWIRDYRKLYTDLSHVETVISEFSMGSGQTLHLELSKDGTEILAYYVYNSTDYDISSDLPVWSGN